MPNWCHSILEITGPEDEIKSIADTDLDFERILPIPTDLIPDTHDSFGMTEFQTQSNLAIHDYESWYSWCIDKWGTKWTPSNKEFAVQNSTTIHVTMDTAWSLPLELLKKVSIDNPHTTIHIIDCEEEAGFFVGDCKILNGKIIEDNIHEPSEEELQDRGMLCEDED